MEDVFGNDSKLSKQEFIETMSDKVQWLLLPSLCRKMIAEVLMSDEPELDECSNSNGYPACRGANLRTLENYGDYPSRRDGGGGEYEDEGNAEAVMAAVAMGAVAVAAMDDGDRGDDGDD